MNEFKFKGEVFYMKRMSPDFDYPLSVKVRGFSRRGNEKSPAQIVEIAFLLTPSAYKDAVLNDLEVYSKVLLSGHMETWKQKNRTKTMFIVEEVEVL